MTNNLTLFPEKIKDTGIFYTVIVVPRDTFWNRAATDIANFDIIQNNVVRYANAMHENHKAFTY